MIQIEDSNNEKFFINPSQVIYVKERINRDGTLWKILLSNGESIITKNEHGANSIINSITPKKKLYQQVNSRLYSGFYYYNHSCFT